MSKPNRLYGEAAFRRLKEHAARKGGECLGRVYRNSWTAMRFRCARGHVWRELPIRVTADGRWCPECRLAERLEKLQAIALAHGGECLSLSYGGAHAKYRMRCAAGHVWKTKAIFISAGHWCPTCRRTGRPPAYDIEDARRAARERGGRLVATSYRRVYEKLAFECGAGHRFRVRFSKVLEGIWCRRCAVERQRLGIGAAFEAARRRGGRCLSTRYVNKDGKLAWQCARGHRWEATLGNVRRGTWCPLCNRPRRLTLQDMHAVASARGGKCVSRRFRNTTTHLWWECADGHQWRATPKNVRQHGTWCPDCARGLSAEEIERRRKGWRELGKAGGRLLAGTAAMRVPQRTKVSAR